jgi:hypothetical protein
MSRRAPHCILCNKPGHNIQTCPERETKPLWQRALENRKLGKAVEKVVDEVRRRAPEIFS